MRFDMLIKGGEVIDPAAGYNGLLDVAITRDKIVAVEPSIPAETAFNVIDASGQYVTPGLIDLHAHLYEHATYWGINADAIGSQSGVTTWVDAGSSGAVNLLGFREHIINRARVKVYAFVNIAYVGMVGQDYELRVPEYGNIEILERVINQNRDVVVGIKVRTGRSGGANDLEPLKRARRAADDLEIPIMVHLSTMPPTLEEVLAYLKPGDIIAHCYTGQNMRLIDESGKIKDAAKRAIDNGLLLDLGHGAGSLSFDSAEALIGQGYLPDTLSTDLHWMSIFGPNMVDPLKGSAFGTTTEERSVVIQIKGEGGYVFNILTVMDKMLCLGLSFPDIIHRMTNRPAEVLGRKGQAGTLKPGAIADIATFVIEAGDYELWDIHGNVRHGKQKVRNVHTLLNGKVFEPIQIPAPPPWVKILGN